MTARSLATFALKRIKIVGAGAEPSADDLSDAIEELNVMLKGWQLSPAAPNLWRQTEGSVTLVDSTASYALSPRPFRVNGCRYRNASSIDLPMEELTRAEYLDLPNKASTGTPTTYYVDYQRATVTLYVWPVPTGVTTETIRTDFQRVFEDIDDAANEIDIPQEFHDVIGYSLADRLLPLFGKDMPAVTQRAAFLLESASAADREAVVRFVPLRR